MSEIIIQTKICNECKIELALSCFYKRKSTGVGVRSICKNCEKHYKHRNKEKIAEQNKKYCLINKEKIAQKKKEYANKNKDHISEYQKQYRTRNKTKLSEYIKQYTETYYKLNVEKIKENAKKYRQTLIGKMVQKNNKHKRRAIVKQGDVSTKQLLELQQNAKVCYWCKCSLKNKKVHIDHYTPLSKGGKHTQDNLVVSCDKCNLQKNAKDPLEFAISIGKLL